MRDTKGQFGTNRQETIEAMEKLCLLDDFLMTLVFNNNIKATELMLNIILQRRDLKVLEAVTQKEYKNPEPGGRSITLDIYAVDADNKVYDVEIQNDNAGADAHRARFHSSMLDAKLLKAKQKFKEIHDSYVIFITAKDYMNMGLPIYHVERIVRESGTYFGDGSHIIYVNGSYKDNDHPIGKLMHDFRCANPAEMFYQTLAEPVNYFKETKGGKSTMGRTLDEIIRDEAERLSQLRVQDIAKDMAQNMAQDMAQDMANEIAERKAQDMAIEIAERKAQDMAIEIAEKKAQDMANEIAEKKAQKTTEASASRMIAKGKLTLEEIAEYTALPLDVVKELAGLQPA